MKNASVVHWRWIKTLIVAFVLLGQGLDLGVWRTLAQTSSANLSIPGNLSVVLEPAEAVEGGAQWALDGGSPRSSAETATGLSAGTHLVQFGVAEGWLKPDDQEVLVIGGKLATMVARYRPVPRFYFRSVPEQRVQVGKAVELLVHTEDADDPQSPGSGAELQMTATPPPAGQIAFESASGRFRYAPVAADRLPFTVTLRTAQGVEGSFEITPVRSLGAEASVIEYDRPMPDAESRDYIQISEVPNAPETFNDAMQETFVVSISGPTLVFANEHRAQLLRQFNARENIRELRLYADKVIIGSPLTLPQTEITIHAREIRFENDGRIDTTPRARARVPAGAVWEDDMFGGHSGDPGHAGGSVNLLVERLSDPTSLTRFFLRGGNGGPAGEGRDGRSELTVNFLSADWYKLMSRANNPICGSAGNGSSVMLWLEERLSNRVVSVCGEKVTAFGEHAVPSGSPGQGGSGGHLRTTIASLSSLEAPGGQGGARGGDHVGGTLSARAFLYRVTNTRYDRFGEEIVSISDTAAPKSVGRSYAAPLSFPGAAGSVQTETNAGAWLHSFTVRSVLHYAKDAYLNGRTAETRRMLGEYQQLIRAHQREIPPEQEISDTAFSEKVNLDQLLAEIENLIHRIDSNLDYFGNPAGWVPMLSFEANLLAFQSEIQHSIPILYLSYWLNHAATNIQASLEATEEAKDGLESERERLESAFNAAQTIIPRLKTEAETMSFRIGMLNGRIAAKLAELEQRARDNVTERHKLPFWKKSLGVLSVVADLIPVGQPTIGRIGAGLGLLAQVDPDHPLQSAKALAPQAFGVMTNKNISVCFGSNAPPVTVTNVPGMTNTPSGTNAVKKARQDRLKQLTTCAKFLGGELKELAGVFKEAQVGDDELAAELEKLKAADTHLIALTLEVATLNADKERFAQELASALQVIGSFSAGLAENLVATHEFEDRIAAQINVLDHGALMHIKEMERRAKDRLVQYQYFLAKAFQYRRLQPFNGNLQLTRLFTRFQQLIEANSPHLLTADEFDRLKGIFVNELRELVAQSLDNVNAPSRSFPKSYRLNADQRRQLNEQGRLVLNLKDLGLINPGDENVRIADLRTRTLATHPDGPVGSLALVRVNYEHRGESRLTSGGRTFLFRHYQTESVNPIVWNAIFDANTGQTVNSTPSAAQQSLISVLLQQQPVPFTNLVFYTQPAAHAEILLTKDVSSSNGTDFVIDDLLFEIQYDFSPTTGNLRELSVRVNDDLKPVIAVSQADINSLQDGLGDFNRVFPSFTLITLQAPSSYGQYVFDRWLVNNEAQTTPFPALAVFLAGNTQVEARYRITGPLRLVPVATPPGQVGFSFVSEVGKTYLIEQSPRLTSPDWTLLEARNGDGSTLQFTRPASANAGFFRLRVSP
ncbi:MAG: hypothetical protein JNN07_12340 [Verrucomicrobiales bacterium]|nr:hypothetical protein [Verrucomicrobiales bacterium]